MTQVTVARYAMATRFEIVLHGEDAARLRAAGEEALAEIERLDNNLSLYRPSSQIARLNAQAARQPVPVSPDLFSLLERIQVLSRETAGAFDVTVGPLLGCWGFLGGGGRVPAEHELRQAREMVGMHLVELNPLNRSVRFLKEGMMMDLGAVGKGYALERAAEILREAGVVSALLNGGTSTVFGLGTQPGGTPWRVGVEFPEKAGHGPGRLLGTMGLEDHALSVSAVWGKAFTVGQATYGHVLDPGTGEPVAETWLAAVAVPSPTDADALSTALLVSGCPGQDQLAQRRPAAASLLARKPLPGQSDVRISVRGPRGWQEDRARQVDLGTGPGQDQKER